MLLEVNFAKRMSRTATVLVVVLNIIPIKAPQKATEHDRKRRGCVKGRAKRTCQVTAGEAAACKLYGWFRRRRFRSRFPPSVCELPPFDRDLPLWDARWSRHANTVGPGP